MLRYISEKLSDENLSGNGILDAVSHTLSETVKYIHSNPESNVSLGYSVKYQLIQIIGNLQDYLSCIESIEVTYFKRESSTKIVDDDIYVNIEKKKKKKLLKTLLSDSKKLKSPLLDRTEQCNEEDIKQGESKMNAGKNRFQIFRPSLKMSKSSGSNARQIYRNKKYSPTYCNSTSERSNANSQRSQRSLMPLKRYHSTEDILSTRYYCNEQVVSPTYDLPHTPRLIITPDDSDSDTGGYISLNTSEQELMPKRDSDEKSVKVKLKVNTSELGYRLCVLKDCHLLIGEEFNGCVAEFVCALTRYSISYELSNEFNLCLCLTHNEMNVFLCFESEEEYKEWTADIKSAMLRVKYISVSFYNDTTDNFYDSVEQPIYERISLLVEESKHLMLEQLSN